MNSIGTHGGRFIRRRAGYYYFAPSGEEGFNGFQLRALAEELERLNKPFDNSNYVYE